MNELFASARRRFVVSLVAVVLLAPALLAVASWPSWWAWIAAEQTPMTWLQSVVLVVTAVGAVLVAYVHRAVAGAASRVWWVCAVGFGGLALDERFALHERVRDGYLAPRDVTLPLVPWAAPGDFLLVLVGLAGLVFVPRMVRALAADHAARRALALGVVLAAVAVAVDSVDPATWTVGAERLQQSVEELVELASGACFLAAIGLRLLGLLHELVRAQQPERVTPIRAERPAAA